jgi:hypothetical protein
MNFIALMQASHAQRVRRNSRLAQSISSEISEYPEISEDLPQLLKCGSKGSPC